MENLMEAQSSNTSKLTIKHLCGCEVDYDIKVGSLLHQEMSEYLPQISCSSCFSIAASCSEILDEAI